MEYINVIGSGSTIAMGKIIAESGMKCYDLFDTDLQIVGTGAVPGQVLMNHGSARYSYFVGIFTHDATQYGWATGTNCIDFGHGAADVVTPSAAGYGIAPARSTYFSGGGSVTTH